VTPGRSGNIPASIRDRLHNVAKSRQSNFNLLLANFATERFLYRLGQSSFADRFVLKGARLMSLWLDEPFRSTRDLDLLGSGDPSAGSIAHAFQSI